MSDKSKFFIDFDGKPSDYDTRSERNRGSGLGESDRVGEVIDPDEKYKYYYLKISQVYPFVEQLTYACYGILIGALQPIFPLSTESSPSPTVLITPTLSPVPGNISKIRYPIVTRWDIWQFGVVPVITMDEINPKSSINAADIRNTFVRYFRKVYFYIYSSLVENGFLPESST